MCVCLCCPLFLNSLSFFFFFFFFFYNLGVSQLRGSFPWARLDSGPLHPGGLYLGWGQGSTSNTAFDDKMGSSHPPGSNPGTWQLAPKTLTKRATTSRHCLFFILQTRFNTHLYTHTQLWAKANRINSLFSFFFFLFIAERERETIGAILLLISFLRLHSRRFSLFLLRPCSSVTTFAGKPSPEVKVSNFFDCWRVITSFVMNLSAYSIQSS